MESKCFIIEETIKLVVDHDKSMNLPSSKKDAEKVEKPKTPPASNPKKTRKRQKDPDKEVSKKPDKEVPTKKSDKKLLSSSIDMDVELLEDQVPPSIIIQDE